ncbi:MAG TPA: hypothetical protein PK677_15690 [Acidiphilium sp.]|nr:MAG: hypothetical protein B7X48_14340 [Acidiphilium sp. 34-60-192]HQT89957.1 hypothetical protein [Acidiphilium sp.]
MSSRLIDDFAAIRFRADDLNPLFNKDLFYADQFMFFELGGDNNLFERRSGGRQIRVRSWSLLGVGQDWEIMQKIVTFASACEGGCLRFAGDRQTLAESYIRKARSALGDAVEPAALYNEGLSCSLEIKVKMTDECEQYEQNRVEELRSHLPAQKQGDVLSWSLSPFHDMKHAALMFIYSSLDKREIYNKARVSGQEYTGTPIMKRARDRGPMAMSGF